MMQILFLLTSLMKNLGFIALIVVVLNQIPSFSKLMQKEKYTKKDIIILSLLFGVLGIYGTYNGTNIDGAIANTRVMAVIAGGLLCGPTVGIASGIIAGLHRLLLIPFGITSIPCAIATIISGFFSGLLYTKVKYKRKKAFTGFILVVLMGIFEIILILCISKPFETALNISKSIFIPMTCANGIGVAILILLIEDTIDQKDKIAASQAKLALEIANETLPYFKVNDSDSYEKICQIINKNIKSDAVAITNTTTILAHVGIGADHHFKGQKIQTKATKECLRTNKPIVLRNADDINCSVKNCPLKSGIIVPLKIGNDTIGTLKIYYATENRINERIKSLAVGISKFIFSQMELTKITELEEKARISEIKALQAQINPHFLFNALNTIASFVRTDPDRARDLIVNLSSYLRYNLKSNNNLVSIYKEMSQVMAYVEIEKARFGSRLKIEYDIDYNIDILIPSLIIQPIVENSIRHGILPSDKNGLVKITAHQKGKELFISITDNGVGIKKEVIDNLSSINNNHVGLKNVNNRLELLYGEGLKFKLLNPGTKISFKVREVKL
ncbi:MAG: histidine kinase [Clostridia bacterium]|jgi:two-component system LytT family sensor kinase|nr:histidine kinase [Clostridia bacterium]MCI2014997.1 histidine kinase [Clostridia bacterium]